MNLAAEVRLKRCRPSEELSLFFFSVAEVNRTRGGVKNILVATAEESPVKRKFIEMPTPAAKKKIAKL